MIEPPRSAVSGFTQTTKPWPILRSLQGYRPWFFTHDLVAGLTLAAIAIPEQLATARLGHFAPQIGFSAFLAGSLASSPSETTASCPAAPIQRSRRSLPEASLCWRWPARRTMRACRRAGPDGCLVLVLGGIFRLGWIADLLSIPVNIGFLAGISVHNPDLADAGHPRVASSDGPMLERLAVLAGHLPQANLFSLGIGFGALAIIAASERIDARIPGALIALIGAAAAVLLMGLESRGVSVLGDVQVALPTLAMPEIPVSRLVELVPLTLIVAVIVMVQTAATTRSFVSETSEPPDVDRDFVGVGAGSILSGPDRRVPVNASPPRTAVVSETGGRSHSPFSSRH